MKKILLSFFLLLFFSQGYGQHCNFTYSTNPGTTLVTFLPNQGFSPNLYTFVWDFGDNTIDTGYSPTHAYNTIFPVVACYSIYDSTNTHICTACDSINFTNPSCFFTYSQSPTNVVVFQTQPPSGSYAQWDFGDSTVAIGDVVTHVYPGIGSYNACLTIVDTLTGSPLCTTCQIVTISSGSGNCSFNYSASTSNNLLINFNVNGVPNSTVSWDFGDSSATGTGWVTSHTFSAPGNYYVCITVAEPNGGTCTYCDLVYVGNNTGNCFSTVAPDFLIPNGFNFTGHPSNSASNVTWDFGDGSSGTGVLVNHSYASPGLYIACMYETDSANNIICSSCTNVFVHSGTNCNFVYSNNPLNNLMVDFNANITPGTNYNVSWDFGDSTTSNLINPSHTYANSGNYLVCVTISNASGVVCSSCDWVTVGNNGGPCTINFFPDSVQQNSFYFNLQSASPSSMVIWDFGDNSMGTGSFVNHVYQNPGLYTVCAIERDSMQNVICQSCVVVLVGNGGIVNCQASFLSSSLGLTAYFIDLSLSNLNTTSYLWDFGDNTTSTTRFPQHVYSSPGIYTVCLTITDGNCIDQFCSPIIVDTLINPIGGCQAFFATVQLAPYQVSVVNLSGGVNLSFVWDFGDGTFDTQSYPSHYYTSTGTYNLCLTVTDANGCTSTYCDSLSVDTLGNVFRGMAGFSLNVYSPMQITGISEVKGAKSFRIYPNPFTSDIQISSVNLKERTIGYRILSFQGSEIQSGSLLGTEGRVQVGQLASGSYLLEVLFSDGSRSYQSILKN